MPWMNSGAAGNENSPGATVSVVVVAILLSFSLIETRETRKIMISAQQSIHHLFLRQQCHAINGQASTIVVAHGANLGAFFSEWSISWRESRGADMSVRDSSTRLREPMQVLQDMFGHNPENYPFPRPFFHLVCVLKRSLYNSSKGRAYYSPRTPTLKHNLLVSTIVQHVQYQCKHQKWKRRTLRRSLQH